MPSAVERSFSYCETSAPETKALSPSPLSTITRTSESRSKRSSTFGIASHMSMEMALRRAGLLNVSQTIEPCFSAMMRSVSSPAAKAGCFRRAKSSSWVMGFVLSTETAIVMHRGGATGLPVLFGPRPRLLDHARQSLRFAAHAGGALLGRVPDHLETETLEPFPDFRRMQRTQIRAVELGNYGGRGAGGSDRAEPAGELEPGQARLGDSREFGRERGALRARHRDRAQLPGPCERHAGRRAVQHDLDFTGKHRVHRERAALDRHVHYIDTRHALEHFHAEMKRAAVSG